MHWMHRYYVILEVIKSSSYICCHHTYCFYKANAVPGARTQKAFQPTTFQVRLLTNSDTRQTLLLVGLIADKQIFVPTFVYLFN